MQEKLRAYIEDKQLAWSSATIKSTIGTLNRLIDVLDGDPKKLWDHLQTQKTYTRVTTWIRVCGFWDYVQGGAREKNPYRQFRHKNARLFRNAYTRQTDVEGIQTARKKIESIDDPSTRKKALELLLSGMRWAESFTYKDGSITGKGGKVRKVSVPEIEGPEYKETYRTFVRRLDYVGLKPHELRKIFLTEFVRCGGNIFELKKVAGWSNLESAKSYIQAPDEDISKITQKVRRRSERRESTRRIHK